MPSGGVRRLPDHECPWCHRTFRPKTAAQRFCENKCRLASLHDGRRTAGKFFDVTCWTTEEDQRLRALWSDPNNSVAEIAKQLNRTPRATKHRAHFLGARRAYIPRLTGERNHFYGREHTDATKRLLSERAKRQDTFRRLAKDSDFQRARRAALYAKPNREEGIVSSLLDALCPGVYQYVGDGKFLVDGLNPDFVNADRTKIIEFFGRSFHDPAAAAWPLSLRSTEAVRRRVFSEHGYKMLVIWDDELTRKKRPEIERRILGFTHGEVA